MADQYLTISVISDDVFMQRRVAACAAQQGITQDPDPTVWTFERRYTWAAAPGWAQKWDSAVAGGIEQPGADPAVITDADVLAVVQPMVGGS